MADFQFLCGDGSSSAKHSSNNRSQESPKAKGDLHSSTFLKLPSYFTRSKARKGNEICNQLRSLSESPPASAISGRGTPLVSSANTTPDPPQLSNETPPPATPNSGLQRFIAPHRNGSHFSLEIHALLIDYLDLASSTALGLTCMDFYQQHFDIHGQVPLSCKTTNRRGIEFRLYQLIRVWMRPLAFNTVPQKFVTWESHQIITNYELGVSRKRIMKDPLFWRAKKRQERVERKARMKREQARELAKWQQVRIRQLEREREAIKTELAEVECKLRCPSVQAEEETPMTVDEKEAAMSISPITSHPAKDDFSSGCNLS